MDNKRRDGFGRPVDEDLYWKNTGLSPDAIERVKEYHRTHPVREDGTRPSEKAKPPKGAGTSLSTT